MKGFKDTTRTTSGFRHWDGGSIGGGTGGTINRLAMGGQVGGTNSKMGDRMHGNSATQRADPPTRELEDHGGKTPLTAGFKKGGHAKHFHVHKHYHAKGGRTHTVSDSYSAAEKHAETYADGGHVHDCTDIPAGSPDYAKGGKIHIKEKNRGALHRDMGVPQGQKIPKSKIQAKLAHDKAAGNTKGVKRDVFALNFRGKKHAEGGSIPHGMNAGGAMYAPGGPVAPPVMGGGVQAGGALGQLAARPRGLPMRPALPMRRAMPMPGPQPIMRAEGGPIPMRKIAKEEVRKHVGYPTPKGHKGLGAALRGR